MSLLCKFFELDIERDFESILNWDFCDLDAEGNDRNRVKLNFEEGQSEEPFSSDLFILLEGNYFLEIVNQAQNVKTICRVSGNHGTKTLQNQSVLLRNNNIAVAIIGDTDHRHSAEVVELLRPYAELAKNAVTLSTKSMVDYRPNEGEIQQDIRNDKVFIKGINSKFSHIKELQAPNMINGVAAGIASWRAFKEQAVESYVIFVRQIHIDGDSAKKVLKLLQDIGAGDTFDYTPKRRQPSSLFL